MKSISITLAAVITFAFSSGLYADQASNPLAAERWKTRPLIVIAPDAQDPALRNLKQALQEPANREAFIERDMVLYTVIAGVGSRNDQTMDAASTAGLLKALAVDADSPARIILVGKDGGKKVEKTGPIIPSELFSLIDKMPMRQ